MKSLQPYNSTAPDRYCRLCEPVPRLYGPQDAWLAFTPKLNALVDCMEDDGNRPNNSQPDTGIDAGYTYFGQFVDHDLTHNSSTLQEAMVLEPEQIINHGTPFLDLGQLYGRGPWDELDGRLYEENDVRLRVGGKITSAVSESGAPRSFDVALAGDGYPLLADIRSSENVVIRQITAIFARLHNVAVEQFRGSSPNSAALFERARQQMVWQYQRLVCQDYLPHVLHGDVYQSVFGPGGGPKVSWVRFSIPIEFAVAALRFGHSMVRDAYDLSSFSDKSLTELTERAVGPGPLEPEWEIDWGRFFKNGRLNSTATISAQPIDTLISRGLFFVSINTLMLFNSGEGAPTTAGAFPLPSIRLPLITLLRGAAMRLPSGQTMAGYFGEPLLTDDDLTRDLDGTFGDAANVLDEYDMMKETPLWYYILKESEVRNNGSLLGPTGSYIIAETIHAALLHDPSSFIRRPEEETAHLKWQLSGGETEIDSLATLFEKASDF